MRKFFLVLSIVSGCASLNYNVVSRDVSSDKPLEAIAQLFALAGEPPQYMNFSSRSIETRWFVTGTPAAPLNQQPSVYVRRFEAKIGFSRQRPAAIVSMHVLRCVDSNIVVKEREVDGVCEEVSPTPRVLEKDFDDVIARLNNPP